MAAAVAHWSDTDALHKPLWGKEGSLTADLIALIKDPLDLWVDGNEHVVVGGHFLIAIILLALGPVAEVGATDCEDGVDYPLAREL